MLDKKIKDGEDLSFNDAFTLMTLVCAALNKPLHDTLVQQIGGMVPQETMLMQATALLSSMSTKESLLGLTAHEIAGMVAATLHLDTIVRAQHGEPTLAFGGMGGDKGYQLSSGQSKLFSLSTLSSIVLAIDGPVHKHHSYPNTSKVAGQSAIEAYGARSDFSSQDAMEKTLAETNLLMTSCHNMRTLHTLSHRLRGETINHVIGPLAFTLSSITPIHAFVGVNEKVHPETAIEALQIIQREGFQTYENSVAYCGTNLEIPPPSLLDKRSYYLQRDAKDHIRLDEIAPPPYASLAAFLVDGENRGTYILLPEDFYPTSVLQQIDLDALIIPNEADAIFTANNAALVGKDTSKALYLAMTIGLGLFVKYYLSLPDALDNKTKRVNKSYLQACTRRAYDLLLSGQAAKKLQQYVFATNVYAGGAL